MQNLGLLFCLYPRLKALYQEGPLRRQAYERHLEHFNTQPYLGGMMVGVVLDMEEQLARGQLRHPERIRSVKRAMSGPVAAIGDSFFWGCWGPFCAWICVCLLIYLDYRAIWPIFLFIFLYNGVTMATRAGGLMWGYQKGVGSAEIFQRMNVQRWIRGLHWSGFLTAAVVLGHLLFVHDWNGPHQVLLAVTLGIVVASWRFPFPLMVKIAAVVLCSVVLASVTG